MKTLVLAIMAVTLLNGCSGSGSRGSGSNGSGSNGSSAGSFSLSSFKPFRKQQEQDAVVTANPLAEDGTQLLQTVAELKAEPTRTGIILRAVSVNSIQGFYDVELAETNAGFPDETGMLTFELRGRPPLLPLATPTARSKEVVAATYISGIELRKIKALRVIAAQNQITIRN
jgi:hypothetical protein